MAAGVATKVAEVTRPRRRARSLVRRVRFAAGVERPIVLMYHRVATPSVDPWNLSVSPARFSEQLAILARARRVVPMHWLAARLAEGKLPRHTAAITFDDGYADFLLAALPILREHGCPATLFLTTGAVGRADGYWWDHLARLTLQAPHLPPFLDLTIGAARLAIPVAAGPAGRRALLDRLAEVFRTTPGDACWAALDALRAWANVAPDAPEADRALTADEVRSLAADPLVEIGAHTVTHPSMPSLDPQRAQWEAAESRRACEALIGRSIAGFSYPFGDHHAASVAAVRQAGLAYACTVEARPLDAASPLFALPRIAVHDWDGATFRSEILTHG
jgi:peptidoglycan/xylan/chitin deacetylase (PgdA/CDA1 family)